MLPVQYRDLQVADTGFSCVRLYRAVLLDALQEIGRYIRARDAGPLSAKAVRRRRELVAWLQATGPAAYGYRVPFEQALHYGFTGLEVEGIRTALLVALDVLPRRGHHQLHARFDSILRRHYVRRAQETAA